MVLVDVVFDTLSLETVRDVLSTHRPESIHVNGYLTCAGCRMRHVVVVRWSVEHVMAQLQEAANMTGGR